MISFGFFAAALVLALILRSHAMNLTPPAEVLVSFPPLLVFLLFFRAIGFYAAHFAAPTVLAMDRNVIAVSPLHTFYFMLGAGVSIFMIWAGIKFYQTRQKQALFSLAWLVAGFIPVSNLIRLSSTVADHWLYPASLGLWWGIALLIAQFSPKLPRDRRSIVFIIVIAVLAAWSIRLYARSLDWSSGLALYRANFEEGIVSDRIWDNYGFELTQIGEYEEAMKAFNESLRINPKNRSARVNRAWILRKAGKVELGRSELRRLLAEDPSYEQAWVTLMLTHREQPEDLHRIGHEALQTGNRFPRVEKLLKAFPLPEKQAPLRVPKKPGKSS